MTLSNKQEKLKDRAVQFNAFHGRVLVLDLWAEVTRLQNKLDTPEGKTEMSFAHTEAVDTLQTAIEELRNSYEPQAVSADALQEVQDYLGSIY